MKPKQVVPKRASSFPASKRHARSKRYLAKIMVRYKHLLVAAPQRPLKSHTEEKAQEMDFDAIFLSVQTLNGCNNGNFWSSKCKVISGTEIYVTIFVRH